MAPRSTRSRLSQRSLHARPRGRVGTVAAHTQTFGQQAASERTGLHVGGGPVAPFRDAATKAHYRRYDGLAQSRIALALKQPHVIQLANFHNTGDGSELHVLGRFLALGYQFERTLFFQEAALLDFRRSKPFVADIAIRPPGQGLVLLPVDGMEFHGKTYAEIFDAQRRNRALAKLGRVVVIPDTMCWRGADLDAFLNGHQIR